MTDKNDDRSDVRTPMTKADAARIQSDADRRDPPDEQAEAFARRAQSAADKAAEGAAKD